MLSEYNIFVLICPLQRAKCIKVGEEPNVKSIDEYKEIFNRYGGIMRTKQLLAEKISYNSIQQLIQQDYVEKVRYGYYQWIDKEDLQKL